MVCLKKSTLSFTLAAASVFLLAPAARAQSDAAEALQKALGMLKGKPVDMAVSIEKKQPEEEGNQAMPGGAIVMAVSSDGASELKSFIGKLDVHVNGEGAIAAATTQGLPQLKAMYDGKRKLFSQSYSGEAYDLPSLLDLLRSTLDIEGLIEETSRAKRVRVAESKGVKAYRVTIDGDFFSIDDSSDSESPQAKMMAMAMAKMKPQVMEGVMTLTLDASGNPASLNFTLQYSDPMKAMMQQAMKGGGGNVQIFGFGGPQGDSGEDHPGEKVTVSYTVKSSGGPAKEFVLEATKLLESAAK